MSFGLSPNLPSGSFAGSRGQSEVEDHASFCPSLAVGSTLVTPPSTSTRGPSAVLTSRRDSQPYFTQTFSSSHPLRALVPSSAPNLPSTMDDPNDDARELATECTGAGPPPGRRLKRLSLLSKPLASPIASSSRRPAERPRLDEPLAGSLTDVEGPSTPRAVAVEMSRERSKGMRSSISYASSPTAALRSPAQISGRADSSRDWQRGSSGGSAAERRSDEQGRGGVGLGLGSLLEEEGSKTPRSQGRISNDDGGEAESDQAGRRDPAAKELRGVTLTEKHADLLTLIAQKERRVNELKLELAQQEQALNLLKQKWTTIATRTARPFTTQSSTSASSSTSAPARESSIASLTSPHPSQQRRSHRPRPLTQTSTSSISSASSSRARSPTSLDSYVDPYSPLHHISNDSESATITAPDVQAVFNNLLATAYGPEGVVTPSAVEGGKRFWGQLVKTVSAAAAGNVPASAEAGPSDGVEAEVGRGLDVSSLTNMVSLPGWSSLMPGPSVTAPTRPIRQPANANRLPRQREHSNASSSSATGSLASPELQTPSLGGGGAVDVAQSGGVSGMSSFQDLLDLDDEPMSGSKAAVMIGERWNGGSQGIGPSQQSGSGDDESDDAWGW